MPTWVYDIVFPLNRWLHIISMTLIVGGTLFFELVLPIAIEDLKKEDKFYVFARARLVFRWVVWLGVGGLVLSGNISLNRMRGAYQAPEFSTIYVWTVAHITMGTLAIIVSLLLTMGRQPPENPVLWMRVNMVILIVAIFLASATRHFQLALRERQRIGQVGKVPHTGELPPELSTLPTAKPATGSTTSPARQP